MTIRSFNQADSSLTGRNKLSRKLSNNTYLERRSNGDIAVRFHATDVVTFKTNGDCVLNAGGWNTVTTKVRLNEHMPNQYRVYSTKGIWYVGCGAWDNPNRFEVPFADGMTIKADGAIVGFGDDPRAKLKLKQQINKFADSYMDEFTKGNVPAPNAGDCFVCQFKMRDDTHVISHMDEKYYVPSLLSRAIEQFPVSLAAKDLLWRVWTGETAYPEGIRAAFGSSFDSIGVDQLRKALKRHLYREVGIPA